MVPSPHPVACERVRSQVSLEVDGELSQLERAMLAAHVLRCADCRAYRSDVDAFTRVLRAAALETAPPVSVRRYLRSTAATRFQAGVAAAMAFAVVGVATQMVQGRSEGSSISTFRVIHFQTQSELEREQALIDLNTAPGSRGPGALTVR
jgi:predicted anti-sigma-YlaC factor YlaD